jgi:lysozyme
MTIVIPDTPYLYGADESFWQDDNSTAQQINHKKMRAIGASFVGIKVSQSNWVDQDFIYNWNNAKYHGFPRMGYHFLDWDKNPKVQAETFFGAIKNDPPELLAVCDYEKRSNHPGKSKAIDYLWNYLVYLEELLNLLDRRPRQSIYTSPGYWKEFGTSDPLWAAYLLWLAHYEVDKPKVPAPWTDWTFWQWGTPAWGLAFGAESKDIDMNWFNGQADEFKALFGVEPNTPSSSPLEGGETSKDDEDVDPVEVVPTPDQGKGEFRTVTEDHLNLRLEPVYAYGNERGGLMAGDEVEILPGGFESNGHNYVPVALYVAEEYLTPSSSPLEGGEVS